MHDRQWTSEALVDIVKGLQEQGYEILDPHSYCKLCKMLNIRTININGGCKIVLQPP